MKKFISALLAICMCISMIALLSSCKKKNNQDEGTTTAADGQQNTDSVVNPNVNRDENNTTAAQGENNTTDEPDAPDEGDEPITPSLTEDNWADAFELNEAYMQVKMNLFYESALAANSELYIAGNVIKTIDWDIADDRIAIDYMEKVNGGWYYYNDNTEANNINASRKYEKWYLTPEDCHGDDEFEMTRNSPKYMIAAFKDAFNSFSYDNAKGGYFASAITLEDAEYTNITVIFDKNKLEKVVYTCYGETYELTFSYDSTPITLPEATEVEK